jgi:hypothetical protein
VWVLFADLVNTFDMVNHKLMLALIEHNGVSKDLVQVIKMVYMNMSVQLQVGKEE